jgi:tRNA nucleotidyltransferase/poly(A) polymerase
VAPERLRSELTRALVGPHARAAFDLLRRTGIEAALAPGARADAAAVIGALPADLTLRLAAWLRGAPRGRVLARLRFGRAVARRIDRLLSLHPIDAGFDGGDASARKIRQRSGDAETLAALIALRAAECAIEQNVWWDAKLAALRAGLEAAARAPFGPADLALRGDEVMAALGCGPGPRVGAALKHLVACVVEDPGANTPERLRALLAEWRRAS